MSLKNGVITKPIKMTDIYNCLGIGPAHSGFDLGYANSNEHKKLNIYSYCKPVNNSNDGEIAFTDKIYTDNLKLKKYKIGDAVPADTIAIYSGPTGHMLSPYRMSDWNNYNHNQFAFEIDLNQTPINGDTYKFDYDTALIHPLINNWYESYFWTYFLYIFEKQGAETLYYLTDFTHSFDKKMRMNIKWDDEATYDYFKGKNIESYKCTIIPVLTNMNSRIEKNILTPQDNITVYLAPKFKDYKTILKDIVIPNPVPRTHVEVVFYVGGDMPENYITNTPFRYSIYNEVEVIESKTDAKLQWMKAGKYFITTFTLKNSVGGIITAEIEIPAIHYKMASGITKVVEPESPGCGGNGTVTKEPEGYTANSDYTLVDGHLEIYVSASYNDPEPQDERENELMMKKEETTA